MQLSYSSQAERRHDDEAFVAPVDEQPAVIYPEVQPGGSVSWRSVPASESADGSSTDGEGLQPMDVEAGPAEAAREPGDAGSLGPSDSDNDSTLDVSWGAKVACYKRGEFSHVQQQLYALCMCICLDFSMRLTLSPPMCTQEEMGTAIWDLLYSSQLNDVVPVLAEDCTRKPH